jgi:hypothetical protein
MPEDGPKIPKQVDTRLVITAAGVGLLAGILIGMKLSRTVAAPPPPSTPAFAVPVAQGPCRGCEEKARAEAEAEVQRARHLAIDAQVVAQGDSSVPAGA